MKTIEVQISGTVYVEIENTCGECQQDKPINSISDFEDALTDKLGDVMMNWQVEDWD